MPNVSFIKCTAHSVSIYRFADSSMWNFWWTRNERCAETATSLNDHGLLRCTLISKFPHTLKSRYIVALSILFFFPFCPIYFCETLETLLHSIFRAYGATVCTIKKKVKVQQKSCDWIGILYRILAFNFPVLFLNSLLAVNQIRKLKYP